MLVLSRRENQDLYINDGEIVLRVVHIGRGVVRLGISAPRHIPIVRAELANDEEQKDRREQQRD